MEKKNHLNERQNAKRHISVGWTLDNKIYSLDLSHCLKIYNLNKIEMDVKFALMVHIQRKRFSRTCSEIIRKCYRKLYRGFSNVPHCAACKIVVTN